jgi:hypothetical protein
LRLRNESARRAEVRLTKTAPHIRGAVFCLGRQDWVWRVVTDRGKIVASGEEFSHQAALQACVEATSAARAYWFWAKKKPRELK